MLSDLSHYRKTDRFATPQLLMEGKFCLWVLFFLIHVVVAPPMPPRAPHHMIDRPSHRQHLKEDSPVFCSRAVSRWVREAWDIVVNDAYKEDKSFHFNDALGPSCPLREAPGDMYLNHEHAKETQGLHGSYRCGICHKTFKTEYHLDRHFDRRHSFSDLILPDSYRGGPVTAIRELSSNASVDVDPSSPRLRRWGVCLEEYCQIFDVCDRPTARKYPLVQNNRSLTHPSHFNVTIPFASSKPVDGACAFHLLPQIRHQCDALVDSCFSVDSTASPIRRANIYIKRNLCGALENCERYLIRRQYAGSPRKFTELAYLGKLTRPISSMPGWQIALLVVGSVALVFSLVAMICCCLDTDDLRQTDSKRASEMRPSAYKSAMENMSPVARRRMLPSGPPPSLYGGSSMPGGWTSARPTQSSPPWAAPSSPSSPSNPNSHSSRLHQR